MSDLTSLIERIEAATEGSRELDGRIWCCINGYEFLGWDGAGCRYFAKQSGWISGDYIKEWTTSIDAALTLLPEGWWWLAVVCRRENHASVGSEIGTVEGELIFETFGATAPIALLAAILRARQAADTEGQS